MFYKVAVRRSLVTKLTGSSTLEFGKKSPGLYPIVMVEFVAGPALVAVFPTKAGQCNLAPAFPAGSSASSDGLKALLSF